MATSHRSQFVGATAAGLLVLVFILVMSASETSFADESLAGFRGSRKLLVTSHATAELPTLPSFPAESTLKARFLGTILADNVYQHFAESSTLESRPRGTDDS